LHVAIIVVSYRSAADLVDCLSALDGSSYRNFSITICENGGAAAYKLLNNALPSTLSHGQHVRAYLAPGNLGYAGGINYCLGLIDQADAYWILNPDTRAGPTTLAALVQRLSRGDCDAVGHDIVSLEGKLASRAGKWHAWSAQSISIGFGETVSAHPRPQDIERTSNYIIGASMLLSSAFVKQAKPRNDYFLYCEEIEWCVRAQRLGLKLGYCPEAPVIHAHGTSTGATGPLSKRPKLSIYLVERNRLLLTRDMFRGRLPLAAALSLLHILARYGRARAWRQIRYGLSGWIAGLMNERGPPSWMTHT
jgi:hypothetical protein